MMHVIVVGGGPAGLMAADVISAAGLAVTVYERMPSLGRKLLMAGRGGLNLTHSEPLEALLGRYGEARAFLEPLVAGMPPEAVVAFAEGLGQATFTGSSGRVFPRVMKASPLLRAWLARLAARGVEVRPRHRWIGLGATGAARFTGPVGAEITVQADAIVLALGGGSWPRLGSDAAWAPVLAGLGHRVAPLAASNVGIDLAWSAHFRERHAGAPVKRIAVTVGGRRLRGEAVVTARGLEGGVIYALNPEIRAALTGSGQPAIAIDLRPDVETAALTERLARPRGKQSLASYLRKSAGLSPVAIGLLHEAAAGAMPVMPGELAAFIKALPLRVVALSGLERAISSAGGLALDEVGPSLMLARRPGVFAAGEMLDWDAPTGGYLLQAALATGHAAGKGVLAYLGGRT